MFLPFHPERATHFPSSRARIASPKSMNTPLKVRAGSCPAHVGYYKCAVCDKRISTGYNRDSQGKLADAGATGRAMGTAVRCGRGGADGGRGCGENKVLHGGGAPREKGGGERKKTWNFSGLWKGVAEGWGRGKAPDRWAGVGGPAATIVPVVTTAPLTASVMR